MALAAKWEDATGSIADSFFGTITQCDFGINLISESEKITNVPDCGYNIVFRFLMTPDENSGFDPFLSYAREIEYDNETGLWCPKFKPTGEIKSPTYESWSSGSGDRCVILKEFNPEWNEICDSSEGAHNELVAQLIRDGICIDPDDPDPNFSGRYFGVKNFRGRISSQSRFYQRWLYLQKACKEGSKPFDITSRIIFHDAQTWNGLKCFWERMPVYLSKAGDIDPSMKIRYPLTPMEFVGFMSPGERHKSQVGAHGNTSNSAAVHSSPANSPNPTSTSSSTPSASSMTSTLPGSTEQALQPVHDLILTQLAEVVSSGAQGLTIDQIKQSASSLEPLPRVKLLAALSNPTTFFGNIPGVAWVNDLVVLEG